MGKTLNIYLSAKAIRVLDDLVALRKELWSETSNRSNTLSDLLVQEGEIYAKSMELVREALDKYGQKSVKREAVGGE